MRPLRIYKNRRLHSDRAAAAITHAEPIYVAGQRRALRQCARVTRTCCEASSSSCQRVMTDDALCC